MALPNAFEYASVHAFCCDVDAAAYWSIAAESGGSVVAVDRRGRMTKARAVSIGIRTPGMDCRSTGPTFCAAPGVFVYGGPYWATPLVWFSSVISVATKSLGLALAHPAMVTGRSSGDENTTASPTLRTVTTRSAMKNSLTMS